MLYALYEAKLLDRAWLLSGIEAGKALLPPQEFPAYIPLAHFLV